MDVERKRPTAWPWVLGLIVLALVLWGVTELLAPPPPDEQAAARSPVDETHEPAAIPAPADVYSTSPARAVDEVLPLGEEDVGQTVTVRGEVVATGNSGFWMLSHGEVVRVDSPRRVRNGDTLSVRGVVRGADPEKTDAIAEAVLSRRPDSAQLTVVRAVKVVEDTAGDGPAVERRDA